jgi:hypothetical protein
MNLKNFCKGFFKPTRLKIVIVIILAMAAVYYQLAQVESLYVESFGNLFFNSDPCYYSETTGCWEGGLCICFVKANPLVFGPLVYILAFGFPLHYEAETIFNLVVGLVYWYVLSCAIVFVFNKIGKK